MFEPRPQEPSYAFIPQTPHPATNCYGKPIETVPEGHALRGKSLHINGDSGIGENPNRYKQHGFYFSADNCIACHACEAACSEKNNLPAHIAFRSVGYVEGGSFPDYTRMNISMACNHCDDPVCLKGCPTLAYTKYAEYGAVLQDPDICFGCGYCTWVCPYNAPQLDPVVGQVSKCNMCVDRLEVGLKPACVSACLAGALDFGVIETTPEHREQLETRLPGFPTPEITHPNIRFQQAQSLPHEMRRTDSMPLRYVRDDQQANAYKPEVAEDGRGQQWNLKKLRSREDPLVFFTLVSQAVVGAFILLFLGPHFGLTVFAPAAHPLLHTTLLFGLLGIETLALVLSTLHLGKPHRFYRAFNNLRNSPVSREVAGIAVFYNLLGAYILLQAFPGLFVWLPRSLLLLLVQACGWGALIAGLAAIYFMSRIYRIPARPFWNHWQVLSSFFGNVLSLGAITVGLAYVWVLTVQGAASAFLVQALALPVLAGVLLESAGLIFHARDLQRGGGEGAASHYLQRTDFAYTYRLRNLGLVLSILAAFALAWVGGGALLWTVAALLVVSTALVGRALFYVLVVPTTMPGAFFWRNAGFVEHARAIGLANMPQVGVVPNAH